MSVQDRPPFSPVPGPQAPAPPPEPVEDEGPFRRPWVCYAIIALSGGLYALETFVPGWGGEDQVPRMLHGPAIQDGQLWRLFTHVFEHGSILHLVLNMSVVFSLGMPLERKLGHSIFAAISFITAMGSATLSLGLSFNVYMLGASGMIIGWGGAMLPIATREGRRALGTWLVQVALISFLPNVSWQGHLGGFLFGLPAGALLRLGRPMFWKLAPFLAIASLGAALAVTHPSLHPDPPPR